VSHLARSDGLAGSNGRNLGDYGAAGILQGCKQGSVAGPGLGISYVVQLQLGAGSVDCIY
jgi:hypothetical protein